MIIDTESHPVLLDIARAHLQELTAILRQLDECLGAFSGNTHLAQSSIPWLNSATVWSAYGKTC